MEVFDERREHLVRNVSDELYIITLQGLLHDLVPRLHSGGMGIVHYRSGENPRRRVQCVPIMKPQAGQSRPPWPVAWRAGVTRTAWIKAHERPQKLRGAVMCLCPP